VLYATSEITDMPRRVTLLAYMYVFRLGKHLIIQRVCDDLAHRIAGFPAFENLFDVEVEIPNVCITAHRHAPSREGCEILGTPECRNALAEDYGLPFEPLGHLPNFFQNLAAMRLDRLRHGLHFP